MEKFLNHTDKSGENALGYDDSKWDGVELENVAWELNS